MIKCDILKYFYWEFIENTNFLPFIFSQIPKTWLIPQNLVCAPCPSVSATHIKKNLYLVSHWMMELTLLARSVKRFYLSFSPPKSLYFTVFPSTEMVKSLKGFSTLLDLISKWNKQNQWNKQMIFFWPQISNFNRLDSKSTLILYFSSYCTWNIQT